MSELSEFGQERSAPQSFLRQIARSSPISGSAERCELCGAELGPLHQHLLHSKQRQIACCCDACAMVFCGQSGAHYVRVPRRVRWLATFQLADLQWEAMMIPINLAFFYYDTTAGKMVAMYPSPAGAIESLLALDTWAEIAAKHPLLAAMDPDVETLLVNRINVAHEYYLVPIDECFRLVGTIRLHWRGLSGGAEVWKQINLFFADLKARATEVREPVDPEATRA